jgi:hypothetical protein
MEMPKPMRQMGAIFMLGLGSVLSSCQTENVTPDGGGLYPADPNGVTKDYIIRSVTVDAPTSDDLIYPTDANGGYTLTFDLIDSSDKERLNLVMQSADQEIYGSLGVQDGSYADMQANLNGLKVDLSSNGSNWVVTGSGSVSQAERPNIFNMDPQFGIPENVIQINFTAPPNGANIIFTNTSAEDIAVKALATNTALKDNMYNLFTTPLAPCGLTQWTTNSTMAAKQFSSGIIQPYCLTPTQRVW